MCCATGKSLFPCTPSPCDFMKDVEACMARRRGVIGCGASPRGPGAVTGGAVRKERQGNRKRKKVNEYVKKETQKSLKSVDIQGIE